MAECGRRIKAVEMKLLGLVAEVQSVTIKY